MTENAIFITATGQHVGKTTCCLGILSSLLKQFSSTGFIKPVGQRHVETEGGVHVDKDVVLFKQQYDLPHPYPDMSPVLIPHGFTRDFLDGKHDTREMEKRIKESFSRIHKSADFTLVEGTGHVGVGSIIGLSNARVAEMLNLDTVIIAQGGLGSTFDELALNVAVCRDHGIRIRGVIVNKVIEKKREMVSEYLQKALKQWNIPLLGCIPFDPILDRPTMRDFAGLFQSELLVGAEHEFRRFERHRIGARTLESFREGYRPHELTILPASREDLIGEILKHHSNGRNFEGAMILTGRRAPSQAILEKIRTGNLPVLYVSLSSYNALKMITGFVAKIMRDDATKVNEAIRLVERHVDLTTITN